jgi:octaprenyl-diphosphate synthase
MSWLDEFNDKHAPIVSVMAQSLTRVERCFVDNLKSDIKCVSDLCARVEQYRGKMLRPTLALLSGLAINERDALAEPSDSPITLAAVTEMIHVATLVHDDVLDDAAVRRQRPTISMLHGNEAAIILGDYLISSAFHLCSSLDNQHVALRIGQITTRICEGELLQLDHRHDSGLDEKTYYEIIERKTASLIGVACELGAMFAGADLELQRRLFDFGVKIGVAFQIQDDLLDLLGDERIVGKSLGKDLEKGKLTLPLIHHLSTADETRRARSLALMAGLWGDEQLACQRSEPSRSTAVAELTDVRSEVRSALDETRSIEYASDSARSAVETAKSSLDALPDTPARRLMLDLADAVLDRDR